MSKMEKVKHQKMQQVRQRLMDLHQCVPGDPGDHWLYEYEGELYVPWEWLVRCEDVAGDEVALDYLGRARIHIIDDEPARAYGSILDA